ncbi:MAG: adenosylmethionine--8-amino-7-oxononanoate transaminase [Chromatiaceae bacterium]|nr:adenosylmethionine--8-amino-7-oxononanoate transaminase [Chromatiaceae bacterium]MCP5444378.1 adenosylmethionine--8-amino-7-oxononanoate transaminase [Chromatiaceae bacterium]
MKIIDTDEQEWIGFEREHVWHPYSSIDAGLPVYPVASARGVRIKLADGRELIDGMSSWWSAIHGYNHPKLNRAVEAQLGHMAHVMFGGLTHKPAAELARRLIELTPEPLQTVFFADSGSVSVEVALKMAVQFWQAKGQSNRTKFVTIRNGYHGDTCNAMSVSDPENGMHSLFSGMLVEQHFAPSPQSRFGQSCKRSDIESFESCLARFCRETAAVILEPVVQGAGGMRFYSADFLRQVRALCDRYDVLLILDEIATGFGRTGRMFACEHAGVSGDIMCVGKALTGGYMTLAATLTSFEVSAAISSGNPGLFMHGPTFMANPLACAAALASLELLTESPWEQRVSRIEAGLRSGLAPCTEMSHVEEVRVLGAIGVVELKSAVDMHLIQPRFVDSGVWVRPFGKLVYLMPPFIIDEKDLGILTAAVVKVVGSFG